MSRHKNTTDHRSLNRRREHDGHGWSFHHGITVSNPDRHKRGQVYMICPCGWFGWVDASVVPQEKIVVPDGFKPFPGV